MLVMKFGGTSVADANRMLNAAELALREPRPAVVVTSAMAGVTDDLIHMSENARHGRRDQVDDALDTLRGLHHRAAAEIAASGPSHESPARDIDALIDELGQLLHGIGLVQELSPRSLDLAGSFGERLAAVLLAAAIESRQGRARAIDARTIIRTDDSFGRAVVDAIESRTLTRAAILPIVHDAIPVVTGYIGSTGDGITTTLGRGGSDYSAALIGSFLDAREIWIWTDVDGVMTADPRVVPEARVLEAITYREAAEMAYFGSKVLHPSTMIPAVEARIPIRVRNSLNPAHPGTLITDQRSPSRTPAGNGHGVKTVSSIADLALVTVEGSGMIGVPGAARRVFAATARAAVNVYMISQASSEHNISFVVRQSDGRLAVRELEREFESEIALHRIDRIDIVSPVGIMAVIGEGMRGTPGVSQRLFTALGRARINVLAIAQGSSELNLSVVIGERDLQRAVGATHTRFGLTRDTHVFLLGKGLVGRALIRQILDARPRLAERHGLGLRVIGVCGRNELLFDPHGLSESMLEAIARGEPMPSLGAEARPDDAELLDRIAASRRLDVVLVDVTADDTGPLHLEALQHGFHIVTANKKPLSGAMDLYRAIRAESLQQGAGYHFETTFGAGLPVLSTLQDLLATRDEVHRITGCFSGTLGFLCSQIQSGRPFSDALNDARERGFTEPDPRDDLSGLDVARKAIIIAREIGATVSLDEIEVEPFVCPEMMRVPDVQTFLARSVELDQPMAERAVHAAAIGTVLRYVAEITPDSVSVGLRDVPRDSAVGQLDGPDNLLVYETARYRANPLLIRGPGAGAEVTAAGVLGDILKIARTT